MIDGESTRACPQRFGLRVVRKVTGVLMPTKVAALPIGIVASIVLAAPLQTASAQDWRSPPEPMRRDDAYRPLPEESRPPQIDPYRRPLDGSMRPVPRDDSYRPPARDYGQPPIAQNGQPYTDPPPTRYNDPPPTRYSDPPPTRYSDPPPPRDYPQQRQPTARYGEPYTPPPAYEDPPPREEQPVEQGSFSSREIMEAGHGFFGSVSKGLANVVEYSFQSKGRPNGYILGQDAGGALVAGLRYGEGVLYTKDAGTHRVYWQGPSIGWDAGAEGSKVMVLVYNLRNPEQIYQRFAGVAGSAYLVGGVGVTFQESDDIVVAPIRAGVGLRFGANVGYLKYTRRPTWNPF